MTTRRRLRWRHSELLTVEEAEGEAAEVAAREALATR